MSGEQEEQWKVVADRLRERFERLKQSNPNEGKYKCWECEKELFNINIDEEMKQKLMMDIEGFRTLICSACAEEENQ